MCILVSGGLLLHISCALPDRLSYIPLGFTSGILFHELSLVCLGTRIFFFFLRKRKEKENIATTAWQQQLLHKRKIGKQTSETYIHC